MANSIFTGGASFGFKESDFAETDSISKVLEDFGNEMQRDLRASAKSADNYVSGNLAESVHFESTILGTKFTFKLLLADYYDFVNKGVSGTETKLNTPYSFKTPFPSKKHVSKLMGWINNKGIASGKERKSLAYAIGIDQKTHGTKGSHFYDKVVTPERLKQLSRDLTKAAANDVTVLISNTAKGVFGISR